MKPAFRLLAAAALTQPIAAHADDGAAPACAAPVAPAGELAPWLRQTPLKTAAQPDQLGNARVIVGQAVTATLFPTGEIEYSPKPEKAAPPASYGGLIGLKITDAGTYRVALGLGAWIDAVRDGKAVNSIAHAHGPACSGVRKMVDFPLEPGVYTFQISGSAKPKIGLLVVRLH